MRWQEKFRPWLLSRLCTAGQSCREASVDVRLSVSESYRNVCEHICGWTRFILPSEDSVGCQTVMTSLTESWGRHTPMLSGCASSPWWHTPACMNTPLSYFQAPTWVRKAAVSLSASWMRTCIAVCLYDTLSVCYGLIFRFLFLFLSLTFNICVCLQHTDMPEEMRVETMELCVTACEKFATNNEVSEHIVWSEIVFLPRCACS